MSRGVGNVIHRRGIPEPVIDVVVRFEVEEPWAHVAADVGLITVEAKPLSTPLQLLGRREAAELAHRGHPVRRRWSAHWGHRGSSWRRTRAWHARGKARPLRRSGARLQRRWRHGRRVTLECPGQIHGGLKVGWIPHLDVDPYVLGEATHE